MGIDTLLKVHTSKAHKSEDSITASWICIATSETRAQGWTSSCSCSVCSTGLFTRYFSRKALGAMSYLKRGGGGGGGGGGGEGKGGGGGGEE